MTERTGLVLLHGAELGAWVWQRVLPLLRSPALALDLPGRDGSAAERRSVRLEAAVQQVAETVAAWDGAERVVLVAHSFSGVLVPPLAAALGPRVAAVVLVGATVPEQGRSWLDLQPRSQRLLLRALYRVRPGGLLSPRSDTERLLCADLDSAATALVLERRVPEAPGVLRDPVPTAELPGPVHVVDLQDDAAVCPEVRAAGRARLADPVVHELAGGHLPMLGRPVELARLLDDIVDGVPEQRTR
jgi:pimeloyl-ACP methyl ester carboxylesterase